MTGEVFGVQWSSGAAGHLGPIKKKGGGGWRGWKVKRRETDGEKEQERRGLIKGEEDKANWAGESDNSFVVKAQNGSRIQRE